LAKPLKKSEKIRKMWKRRAELDSVETMFRSSGKKIFFPTNLSTIMARGHPKKRPRNTADIRNQVPHRECGLESDDTIPNKKRKSPMPILTADYSMWHANSTWRCAHTPSEQNIEVCIVAPTCGNCEQRTLGATTPKKYSHLFANAALSIE
jgi:hypothetical protein